ncbi:MAG: L,D-transpeptidase [Thermomicrobiales bacterium]|nr:L,D-transpeptidase [Thermomicrobiales bacterium]
MLASLFRTSTKLLIVSLLTIPLVFSPRAVIAAAPTAAELGLPEAAMPREFGASSIEAYVSETGHSVTGYMLDYWRANGAASVYGNPISQPYAADNHLYSQAFERGIFQYSEVWLYSDDAAVRLKPVIKEEIKADRSQTRSDGRRGGADRRSGMMPAAVNTVRANEVANEGGRISKVTGFGISGVFGQWYDNHEGWFYLGAPVSEPMRIRGVYGQMFENGILLLQDDQVNVAPLPRENPEKYGIDTTPIAQGDMPVYSETLFYTTYNPYGVDPTTIDGPKRIEVSISEQTMWAYQGDTLVLQSLVSTGKEPNHTEIGFFHVRIKYKSQTMEGFTNGSGEVISLGSENEGDDEGEAYRVEDVPDIMYINYEAEALHGAYWHNNFGQRMSHGCINQPLDVAAFMFEFAPLGTPVTVRE